MRVLSIITIIIFCTTANAKNITPETLWQLGRLADVQLSPDGSKIVYNVRTFSVEKNKGNSDLWIYDMTSKKSTVIANDSTSNETSPRWSADGTTIYYLNDKNGSSQLYSMGADGSGKKQISKLKDDINEYEVSANGKMIWVTHTVAVDKMNGKDIYTDLPKTTGRVYDDLMMRHWDSWKDGSYSHVFVGSFDGEVKEVKDIMPGESWDAPLKPHGGSEEIAWSPDGRTLAYTCKKMKGTDYAVTTNSDIYLYDVASGKTINISVANKGYDKAPLFSPDGKYIAYISWEEPGNEASLQRLFLYDMEKKSVSDLSGEFEYNVEHLQWSGNSDKIYFISNINATDQIFVRELNGKSPQPRQLTTDMVDYTEISIRTVGGKDRIAAARMSISSPTEIYSVDAQSGKSAQLTTTNQEVLKNYTLGKVERMMIRSTDNKEILTWVIYPPDFDPSKKYPTLLFCQGGPQSTVSQFFSYRWNFQLMAANGYIIVAPNRRGLPGFGKEWNDQISGDWGGQAMQDLLSAIDSVAKYPYVNKEKLGAVGASFGGYSVFWLAGNHNKRFKAFISHCGVYNMESMLGTEELFFYNHENERPYFVSPKSASYTKHSPHLYADKWDTPILVISNEKDYRIPYSQGLEAYTAARLKNVPARFLSFPDEGHWVLRPQNSLMWQREFFGWLDKWLK